MTLKEKCWLGFVIFLAIGSFWLYNDFHWYTFKMIDTEDIIVRMDCITGKVESRMRDYPWFPGYFTDAHTLQALYEVPREIKKIELETRKVPN